MIASGATVAQTTPAQAQEPSCASMTGTARADCERAENASHALCFGMSGSVRADCVKSYNPNRFRGQQSETTKGSGDTGMSGAPATGTPGSSGSTDASSGNATAGDTGAPARSGGASK